MEKNYQKTLLACYLGFITQAISANFTPLLFLKFHTDYNIPLGKIALIPTAFFLTQLLIDVWMLSATAAVWSFPRLPVPSVLRGWL